MEWKKYSIEDTSLGITGVLALFLFFASFYFKSFLIFFTAVFLLLFIFLNSFYLKHVGKKLSIENKKIRNKFFPNENGEWVLTFENKGLPIMKGTLKVFFDDQVAPLDGYGEQRLAKYEVNLPFSVSYQQKLIVKIPFKTIKRGTAKIRSIEMSIPHFFGLGETVLEYKYLFLQEALVYPVAITVMNKSLFLSERLGESNVNHSLNEDFFSPAGTRDYVYSDSFNRINWKASARAQTLQTKLFDHVSETGWNISLNVANGHSLASQAEQLISSAAELAYYLTKHHIPFSLCINIRIAGTVPFYYIPAGGGKEQLQKVLEVLALIDPNSFTYPYEKMLSFYNRHLMNQPFFIHGGIRSDASDSLLHSIKQKGTSLFEIHFAEEEKASLLPMTFAKDVVEK
ncbi:DUF58 domain-containing protein [Cytobacillus depressus]|uniref:DUF58 domain-containing protein n=1 Tax=Cytobacillus depressus TaxID=1602942 RepID=A0A6L3VCE8_9BACI|nr:DUF58 domain-containing protein [Cytobacillus depressus]KAB2337320.1 DUF58 domain-containing protein [Cytobacillus depressus]